MKLRQKNYLVAGIVFCVTGIFLVYKNSSLGKYIDPWLSHGSKYKGSMSYWVAVAGIAMVIIGLLLSVMTFSKDSKK